jgi:hypothetical protein
MKGEIVPVTRGDVALPSDGSEMPALITAAGKAAAFAYAESFGAEIESPPTPTAPTAARWLASSPGVPSAVWR